MMTTFAERLRVYRGMKGLSQAQLAEKLGVAMNTVSLWELGKQGPRTDEMRNSIAEVLEVTWSDLYGVPEYELSDREAAAMADAEEQEELEQMVRNYRKLLPQHQEIVRKMILMLIEMEESSVYNANSMEE